MSRRFTLAAALSVSVLAGCGGAPDKPATAPSDGGQQQQQQKIESIRADCMKQKGFKYVAFVYPPFKKSDDELSQSTGDYKAMKTYREKYGFGAFAAFVYPDKFMAKAMSVDDEGADPNFKIEQALPEAQRKVYREANDACYGQGVKQVLGKDVKGMMDHYTKAHEALEQIKGRELNGDPKLVELASAMASCLKAKGYRVGATQPKVMATRGRDEFQALLNKVSKMEKVEGNDRAQVMTTNVTPETARPHLAKEVKAALDDLECGKAFYPLYLPKDQEISQRVSKEFGLGFLA